MPDDQAAALVVLRPDAAASEAGERAQRWFAQNGFETGPLVGISFSIVAPRDAMSRSFSGYEALEGTGGELPLDALPDEVRQTVQAVATEAPPDFGPGNP
jgi:hypothetical protein